MSVSAEYAQSVRLCRIAKRQDFDGYGFNLHAEKGKHGQFIGKVDENSPAEAAGLKEGDRIIEVNGVNVADENHKQVVNRIKAVADSTELLVVDPSGDSYFKTNNIEIDSNSPFVVKTIIPVASLDQYSSETDTEKPPLTNNSTDSTAINRRDDLNNIKSQEKEISSTKHSSDQNQTNNEKTTKNNTLNLNMTARELRAQLAARKKYDPKKDYSLDAKKKYDIVQKL